VIKMPINPELITPEIMNNTVKREVYPEIQVVAEPKNGKVRTVYYPGQEHLLQITSDNLSTHDVVHKRQVYAKGDNVNAISAFYFNETFHIIANHFIDAVAPNTWLTWKAKPILVEMVFRKYLTGSGWDTYKKNNGPEEGMLFCGASFRPGYRKNEMLDDITFTPTAKGQVKDFDIPEFRGLDPEADDPKIDIEMIRRNYKAFGLRQPEHLDQIIESGFKLYRFISADLEKKGHLLADTKWEFGYLQDGTIALIDECVTPDSSRFWKKEEYVFNPVEPEFTIISSDKQHFRNHVEALKLHENKAALAQYWMPDNVMREGIVKYCDIREAITGTLAEISARNRKEEILDRLASAGYLL
jgi:phosphoribosylaminoimidazole-succinocarboxamide synthase